MANQSEQRFATSASQGGGGKGEFAKTKVEILGRGNRTDFGVGEIGEVDLRGRYSHG